MVNSRTRFVMVGGFLGAGKTMTLARLARSFIEQGSRVGLVTNDQAFDLVDTRSLRSQGFDVGEVPGACFCCKFDDLVATVGKIKADAAPDIVITEPVGSCTDLMATVIEPLRHLHGDDYEIAPLAVLLKPEHGQKILRDEQGSGFSPKAEYIFLKQLEEAEIIVINKIDKLTDDERRELRRLIEDRFPGKDVIEYSAKEGFGHGELLERLDRPGSAPSQAMEVDYDVYAEGEAELGWLNSTHLLRLEEEASLDQIATQFVGLARDELAGHSIETAHLKVLAETGEFASLANLVGSNVDIELSLSDAGRGSEVRLTVNARVASSPDELRERIDSALGQLLHTHPGTCESLHEQSFRPGRPVPTHRMGASD